MSVCGIHRVVSGVIFGCLLAVSSGQAAEPAFLRVHHDRPEGAIVGEKVTLSVELLTETWLNQAATISVPEIPGLVILRISQFGINGTERVGAATYTTQTHQFAVFARRSGRYVIPAFRLRFAMAGESVGTSIPMDLKTDPIELVAELPSGAENVEGLIATTDLSVVETWDPDARDEMSVGDALKRSVLYRAVDVMGMAFPPTRFDSVDGLGVYPEPPELDDRTERGEFLGSRIDAVTYVFERPGTFVLPGLKIPWWDLETRRLRQAELPSRSVVVVGVNAAVVRTKKEPESTWVWFVPAFLLVGMVLIKPVRRRLGEGVAALRSRRAERSAFRVVIKACRLDDGGAAYQDLRAWHRMVLPGCILSVSAAEYGDRSLLEAIRDLEMHALHTRDGWRGAQLADRLGHWRRFLKARQSHGIDGSLPPLNP